MLLVNAATVARARKRYVEEGLEAAINDRPRPGQERKLDGKQEAHLIAIACRAAPEGHTHWTLQLWADQVVELEFADSISLETVRQMLKKTNSSRGRSRSGVSPSWTLRILGISAVWYNKPFPTFLGVIALARPHFWLTSEGFLTVARRA